MLTCHFLAAVIATSGPSGTYPQRAYRNPLDQLVAFLDAKHGDQWAIWEFRAEGTGYPDEEVHNRIWHFPWPDHHPPPFVLVPRIMASMRNWLHGDDPTPKVDGAANDTAALAGAEGKDGTAKVGRVIVGHCKAGKGRTGSMAVSYLISQEGWAKADALTRFTERRMRPGMGAGVSIPSQLRWIDYVERWAQHGKLYVESAVEVTEAHIYGMRDGVKVAVEGYVDEGRTIKTFHVFRRGERDDVDDDNDEDEASDRAATPGSATASKSTAKSSQPSARDKLDPERPTNTLAGVVTELLAKAGKKKLRSRSKSKERDPPVGAPDTAQTLDQNSAGPLPASSALSKSNTPASHTSETRADVIYRPSTPIIVPTSDINLAIERRSRAGYGWTLVTSVAHVWFNVFFEGNGPEKGPQGAEQSGVFSIDWEAMDGIKGSARKGPRAFDRVSIVWRIVQSPADVSAARKESHIGSLAPAGAAQAGQQPVPQIVEQPSPGEPVADVAPADWKGRDPVKEGEQGVGKVASDLGLRPEATDSADVSKAGSLKSAYGDGDGGKDGAQKRLQVQQADGDESASEEGAEGIHRGLRLPDEKSTDAQDTVEVKAYSNWDVPGDSKDA